MARSFPAHLSRALASNPLDTGHRRGDIQGLRAVAVLLVVLFHTGLVVDAGFIGVDIFFVISGFVITSMLLRQAIRHGSFSLRGFYMRRFRRLVPALALTITATMLIGTLIFSPVGAQETAAQTAIGAMLITSNLVIARVSGSYFGVPAETNPLLNLWSLSVEEQFYLVFPLVVLCAFLLVRNRKSKRSLTLFFVLTLTILSFAVCLAVGQRTPVASDSWFFGWLFGFYSPLTRAWEFGAGAILACLFFGSRHSSSIRRVFFAFPVALVGIVLIALGLFLIGSTTPFPSAWTLLPVLGTMAVIAGGSQSPNLVSRILSWEPLQKVGDWSYSIYLWNWPIVMVATYIWPGSRLAVVFATICGFIVAIASFRFWEQPLRRSLRVGVFPPYFVATSIVLVPLTLGAVSLFQANSLTRDSGFMKSLAWESYFIENFKACSLSSADGQPLYGNPQYECFYFGNLKGSTDVRIIGDSHAQHIFPGLVRALPDSKIQLIMADGPNLELLNNSLDSVPVTLVAGFWEDFSKTERGELSARIESFTALASKKSGRVLALGDVPRFVVEASDCAFPAKVGPDRCSEAVSANRLDYAPIFRDVLKSYPNMDFVELRDLFCRNGFCRFDPEGEVLYRDSNHLNPAGSDYVAKRIAPYIEKQLS